MHIPFQSFCDLNLYFSKICFYRLISADACPNAPNIANAAMNESSNVSGDTVSYSCIEGKTNFVLFVN